MSMAVATRQKRTAVSQKEWGMASSTPERAAAAKAMAAVICRRENRRARSAREAAAGWSSAPNTLERASTTPIWVLSKSRESKKAEAKLLTAQKTIQ